jgi:hypothetical protein
MDEYEIINTHLVSYYNLREEQARDIIARVDRTSSLPLASNTKKREGKTASSLRLLFDLIIIVFFTIVVSVAVPSPRVFYSGRRKRRVDYGLGGLKTHRSAHFTLALLQVRKHLAHLLVRLMDKGVIGAAHGDEGLKAIDKNILLLVPMSGSSRRLRSS